MARRVQQLLLLTLAATLLLANSGAARQLPTRMLQQGQAEDTPATPMDSTVPAMEESPAVGGASSGGMTTTQESPAINATAEESPAPIEESPTPTYSTVAAATAANPDLSRLRDAVRKANLTILLSDPLLVATIFAPTNEAFDNAQSALGDKANDTDFLAAILAYHVVPGIAIGSDAAIDSVADGPVQLTTLEGSNVTVSQDEGGALMVDTATVVTPDVVAGLSIIHVIDTVLLPSNRTMRGGMNATESEDNALSALDDGPAGDGPTTANTGGDTMTTTYDKSTGGTTDTVGSDTVGSDPVGSDTRGSDTVGSSGAGGDAASGGTNSGAANTGAATTGAANSGAGTNSG